MLDYKIVIMKLRDFGLNYSIKVEEDYLSFIFKSLKEKGITNQDFTTAIDNFMEKETTIFNKMPNLAMFLKYSNKQLLTIEDDSKIKSSTVISWLEKNVDYSENCYYNPPKKQLSSSNNWGYEFDDNSINYVIEREFGSTKGLIERFFEQKVRGYLELFRKELIDMFRVQNLHKPENLKVISNENKNEIENIIKNVSNKLTARGQN